MSTNQPRFPIAIVGAGIAGLAAGFRLQQLGVPFIILERFERSGGRLNSRTGDGWLVDHGAQYLKREDIRLCSLVRALGMESNRVVVQGGVHRLTVDGQVIRPNDGGIDNSRLALDRGMAELANRLSNALNVRHQCGVSAVRWDNDDSIFWWDKPGKIFWFEDDAGEPLRDPISQETIKASGVIMATTATAARKICEKSRSIEQVALYLKNVHYDSCFTAIYKVPRQDVPFYALRGDRGQHLAWVAFEERKVPGRIDDKFSLIVVQASGAWSRRLFERSGREATAEVYAELRNVIPSLPEAPYTQTYKRWNVSRPESAPLGTPMDNSLPGRWPTNPADAPFALAGDYIYGSKLEDAVRAGEDAADSIISQLPARRRLLGIELPA